MNRISKLLAGADTEVDILPFLDQIEWSTRAKNLMINIGVTKMQQLVDADMHALLNARHAGLVTFRELIEGCVSLGLRPRWLRDIAPRLQLHAMMCVPSEQFVKLAGPYGDNERWMLEIAMANLRHIPHVVVTENDGYWLYRDKNGVVEVQPENESTDNISLVGSHPGNGRLNGESLI